MAYDSGGPAAIRDDDLRFLDAQARSYLDSGARERLGDDTVLLRLKAGSWYEACAQAFRHGSTNLVFLFPGSRDLRALQQAGMGEPPAGTVLAELKESGYHFAVITPEGWSEPDRLEVRLMTLALAAMRAVAAGGQDEATGDLSLPGGVRGRYVAQRVVADRSAGELITGVPRFDLYGDGDCTMTMLNLPWQTYDTLRRGARHYQGLADRFIDQGNLIPVVVISGDADLGAVTGRLRDCDPLGLTFGETAGILTVLAAGRHDSYALTQVLEERESMMAWWYEVKKAGGAHAVVVTDGTPDLESGRWGGSAVYGVFEFGRQSDS